MGGVALGGAARIPMITRWFYCSYHISMFFAGWWADNLRRILSTLADTCKIDHTVQIWFVGYNITSLVDCCFFKAGGWKPKPSGSVSPKFPEKWSTIFTPGLERNMFWTILFSKCNAKSNGIFFLEFPWVWPLKECRLAELRRGQFSPTNTLIWMVYTFANNHCMLYLTTFTP